MEQLECRPTSEMEAGDQEAESLCRWAAGRAGVIVVVPVIGTIALVANEVYMIVRIAKVYGKEVSETTVVAFIASLGAAFVGQTLATLIPFPPLQVPIGMSVTYGLGKVAQKWIKDGMPNDVSTYKATFEEAKAHAKENLDEFKQHPDREVPLGDEKRKFKV